MSTQYRLQQEEWLCVQTFCSHETLYPGFQNDLATFFAAKFHKRQDDNDTQTQARADNAMIKM